MTGRSGSMRLRRAFGSRKISWVLGVLVLAVFACSVVFGINATHGMPLAERKTIKAAFKDVGGLQVGDDVRIAGARVGFVDGIRVERGQSVAVLKIDDKTMKIYRNTTATNAAVTSRSALGQKFVGLNPGTRNAGELPDGAIIPEQETESAKDVDQLFNVFDAPTRQATGVTVRALGGGTAGHGGDVNEFLRNGRDMLPDLANVSRSLATNHGDNLTAMMQSGNTLSARFNGRQQEIADLTQQVGTTMNALAVDGGKPVRDSLKQAPDTLREARGTLDALDAPLRDTKHAATVLRPGAESLGAATPDLRGVLREGVPPLNKVPGVAISARPAVEDLTGVMANARPVSEQLVKTANRAATPLSALAPYSGDMMHYFTAGANALSHGDAAGNWLRIYLVPRAESASGTLPVKDPTVNRSPYPGPGKAAHDSASTPLPGGR